MPGIFAIGDCTPNQALAHKASKEGINAAEYIGYLEKKFHHQPEGIDYGNVPGCTYCVPEVASVGMTEKAAKMQATTLKWASFLLWPAERPALPVLPKVL